MDDEPTTEELRIREHERAERERERADAGDPEDARTHERRADRSRYLESKLAERERAERDGG